MNIKIYICKGKYYGNLPSQHWVLHEEEIMKRSVCIEGEPMHTENKKPLKWLF